ncbi:ribosomal l28 family protein [Sarocladium implicatum]|nr:ribosomal l28 family protein [Sarocladium implicatum]
MPPPSLRPLAGPCPLTGTLSRLSLHHNLSSSSSSAATLRPFSTTTHLSSKTVTPVRLPSKLIPPYPHGRRLLYKQSNTGLYASARIRFGNIVSARNNKARRTWKPNVRVKNFYLREIDATIKTKLTYRVLKTIVKEGGLVNYLLKSKPQRVKDLGPGGWNLRWLLMQSKAVQERMNDERRAMGLPEKEVVDRSELIHYALDYATPGPLSIRARETREMLRAEGWTDGAFALGDEAASVNDIEAVEVTPEEEAQLVKELEDEASKEIKIKTEKAGVEN